MCLTLEPQATQAAVQLLLEVFVVRFSQMVITYSQGSLTSNLEYQADDFSGLVVSKLSHLEKELYKIHRDQAKAIKHWRNNEIKLVDRNPDFLQVPEIPGGQTLIAGLGSIRMNSQQSEKDNRLLKRVRQQ